MSTKRAEAVVLLPTDNCVERLDESVRSALDQSFPRQYLRIVAVDNASTDGTYEKLLGYARENDIFSVYRVSEKLFSTKLLVTALKYLEATDYTYLTILCPGDRLYPDCIDKCIDAMNTYAATENGVLLFETDLIGNDGNVIPQIPVYSRDCVLMKTEHYTQFFTSSPRHRIQSFLCKHGILPEFDMLPFLTDYTDWFKKAAISFRRECIYMKKPLAAVRIPKYSDLLSDLLIRLFLVKRLEMTRAIEFSHRKYEYLDKLTSEETIYRKLALLALLYASEALMENDLETAGKIVLFSEMVCRPIIETDFFTAVKSSLESGKSVEKLDSYLPAEKSIAPPEGAKILADLFVRN